MQAVRITNKSVNTASIELRNILTAVAQLEEEKNTNTRHTKTGAAPGLKNEIQDLLSEQKLFFSKPLAKVCKDLVTKLSKEGEVERSRAQLVELHCRVLARAFLIEAFSQAIALDFREPNGLLSEMKTDDLSSRTYIAREVEVYSKQLIRFFEPYGEQQIIEKIIAAHAIFWPE